MNYEKILDIIETSLKGKTQLNGISKKKPFKILISTILSARTRDTSTKDATDTLFAKFNTPELIAKANIAELEQLIYKVGFYKNKAHNIKETSKILIKQHNSKVPKEFNELIKLPGVGRKTANCVLAYAFNIPAICTDVHVHRISNRLGWVKTKKPEETEKALSKIIPKEQWIRINKIFVKFGQQICVPINPKHQLCPIESICPKDFTMENEMKKARERRKNQ